jgi:aminoglycoside 3-N-acetyltransferase
VYDLDGSVLLLGVGFGNHTSFHLSESRAEQRKFYQEGSPLIQNGARTWVTYEELDWNDEPFEQIGTDFEKTGHVRIGSVGAAPIRLFSQRSSVDFAVGWMNAHPFTAEASLHANS